MVLEGMLEPVPLAGVHGLVSSRNPSPLWVESSNAECSFASAVACTRQEGRRQGEAYAEEGAHAPRPADGRAERLASHGAREGANALTALHLAPFAEHQRRRKDRSGEHLAGGLETEAPSREPAMPP